MSAKLIELELAYGEQSFYCPICGTAILDVAKDILDGTCPHFLFYRNEDAGGFDRVAERIATDLSLDEELEQTSDWKQWINRLLLSLPDTAVVFCIAEPGRGGGHQASCNYYCFDFATPEDF